MNTRSIVTLPLLIYGFWGGFHAVGEEPVSSPSAFRYQGQLLDGATPANGVYEMSFDLYLSDTGGAPSAPTWIGTNIAVSNGLFAATLDFGADVFDGRTCWLEIGVRPAQGSGDFILLRPRQPLSPAPYAIHTLKAERLTGPLPDAQLSPNIARLDADQLFTGTITFGGPVRIGTSGMNGSLDVAGQVRGTSFAGDGSGLSNVAATAFSAAMMERLWRVPIPFVTVSNANNQPDELTGKGAVPYDFRIGKYEITHNQYVVFLNAVAADDAFELYDTNMTADIHGGILRSGNPGEYSYSVKPGMGHQPVCWVDFADALRFCNWLHHGQPSGSQNPFTTENGAYTITSAGILANDILRNPGARFWLPSDDEWYKAAYHQPASLGGTAADYWEFPCRNFDVPISEPPPGGFNSANVCCETERLATDVGAYVNSRSFYGTFDQGGNLQEWTEEIIFVGNRRIRGGSWNYNEYYTGSTDFEFDTPDYDADGIGFRVAGAVAP